jgi:hypothetical protein
MSYGIELNEITIKLSNRKIETGKTIPFILPNEEIDTDVFWFQDTIGTGMFDFCRYNLTGKTTNRCFEDIFLDQIDRNKFKQNKVRMILDITIKGSYLSQLVLKRKSNAEYLSRQRGMFTPDDFEMIGSVFKYQTEIAVDSKGEIRYNTETVEMYNAQDKSDGIKVKLLQNEDYVESALVSRPDIDTLVQSHYPNRRPLTAFIATLHDMDLTEQYVMGGLINSNIMPTDSITSTDDGFVVVEANYVGWRWMHPTRSKLIF